jgi:hypothetical protein
MIAAYDNISCQSHFPQSLYLLTVKLSDVTVEVYMLSLKERTKLKGLLEVVSSSAEFDVRASGVGQRLAFTTHLAFRTGGESLNRSMGFL